MAEPGFTFRPLSAAEARAIVAWRYPPPYDFYNLDPDSAATLQRPDYHYHAVIRGAADLVGFRCFGADARVAGGDYSLPALDMGGGLRPDLTGQGLGRVVLRAAISFAVQRFRPVRLRTTVAAFNERAIRTCLRVGYVRHAEFARESDRVRFIIFLLDGDRLATVAAT